MKKLILAMFMVFAASASVNAQSYVYQARQFAMKTMNSYGTWNPWSDWERSVVRITIDTGIDVIYIHTEMKQVYVITQDIGSYVDNYGGKQRAFSVVDQDGDKGTIRLRIEKNGNVQLYVEFSDIIWVYSGLIKLN
jgi:hypothetical protein